MIYRPVRGFCDARQARAFIVKGEEQGMTYHKAASWLATGVSALGIAACGSSGSNTVSKATIISKGDTICRNATKSVTAASPNFDPGKATAAQIKTAAPFLQQLANSTLASVNQIAALGKPDKDAALLNRLLAEGRMSAALDQALAQTAQKGDVGAFKVAFAKVQGRSGGPLAKQFGFKVCAQRSG